MSRRYADKNPLNTHGKVRSKWAVGGRTIVVLAALLFFVNGYVNVHMHIAYFSTLDSEAELDQLSWMSEEEVKASDRRRLTSNHAKDESKHNIINNDTNQQVSNSTNPEGASAFCLLVKDDNELLPEWIAYHYHVFNMRRLIVAVDPESKTTPLDVLEAWGPANGNFDLDFTIWDDKDYTPKYFQERNYSEIPNSVNRSTTIEGIENIPRPQHRKASLLLNKIIKTDWHTNESYVAEHQEEVRRELFKINDHRFRQSNFLAECYREIWQEHPNSKSDAVNNTVRDKEAITWTVHIDTDEYLVPNPWIGLHLDRTKDPHLESIVPETPSAGSLWSFFRRFLSEDEDSRVCVMMPRILFGSKEMNSDKQTKWESSSKRISWNHTKFESLRWKYHTDYVSVDTRPKAITNPGLMHETDQLFTKKLVFSIHRPIANSYHPKPGCKRQPLRIFNEFQFTEPLAVYHYLGSIEKYLARKDLRRGRSMYDKKNESSNFAFGDENNPGSNEGRWWIGGWLDDFVETHGGEKTYSVLGERWIHNWLYSLKYNNNVTELSLCANNIGDEGAKHLADALEYNNTLTELYLTSVNIGEEGTKALANALKVNTTLTRVWLDQNRIGDDGAKALANALKANNTLTKLDLDRIGIGYDGTKALASALEDNTALRRLTICHNNIGDYGAKPLAKALTVNNTLTNLDLTWNKIGDDGAKAIANALKENSSLAYLYLRYNNIGDKGATALADALTSGRTFVFRYLRNAGGNWSASVLSNALKYNSTLKELYLVINSIGDEGVKAILNVRKYNSTVRIMGVNRPNDMN